MTSQAVPAQATVARALDVAVEARRPRLRWPAVALVVLVAAGIGLRFVSVGPLWLDEAQSVAIARGPLHLLPQALQHDGAPPLWYVLLHAWMSVFGDSTYSVRLMAALPALIALPVVWSLGTRLFGRDVGRTSLVLLATSPFAIRYAVEARMYSLLLLLGLLGAHALLSVHRSRRPWPAALTLAAVTSAALYTHYYAIWAGLVVGAGELWLAVRRRDRRAAWAVGAVAAGGISFVPWLPTVLYQNAHTGAPWLPPPSINAVLDTFGAWAGGVTPASRLVQLVFFAAIVIAVLGRRGTRRTLVVGRPAATVPLRLFGVVIGVLAVAVLDAMANGQAFAPRYTSVVTGVFVVLVAAGIHVLPSQRARRLVVAGVAGCGVGVAAVAIAQPRTQAGTVAAELRASSHPGDIVLYCPDQLGPASARLLSSSLRLRQYVYPNLAPPQRVDWVDYAQRQESGDPYEVGRQVNRLAGNHTIWLVWAPGARSLGSACSDLVTELSRLRGSPYVAVSRDSDISESMSLDDFDAQTPS